VVFSFFKKKDQSDDQPKQPSIKLPAGQAPATTETVVAAEDFSFGDTISFDPAKIEVSETSEGLEPIVEEAAMLFANDQIDAATALLNQYLAGHPTESSDEPWLMLFELHQQKGAKNAFDELAMQFVLKFERTAPVWRSGEAEMPAAVQQTQTRSNYFSFVGTLGADSNKLSELSAAATKGERIRLDFSKFDTFDGPASLALQQALQACRKAKTPVQLLGGERLIQWLQGKVEIMRPEQAEIPFWLLLIEVYQTQGNQEIFENLAVDYAVTYEVSPPSWETPVASQIAVEADEEEATPEPEVAGSDIFPLRGVITDQSGEQLQKLAQYATEHRTVHIDSSTLDRIDFVSAGNLLNVLLGLTQQDKSIIFDNVSALVFPLFRIMGISDVTTVNRRK